MKIRVLLLGVFLFYGCVTSTSSVSISTGSAVEEYYNINDIVVIIPELPKLVDSVEFFWDSNHIDTQKSMPFVSNYQLENEEIGVHEIKYVVYHRTSVESIQISTSTSYKVNIIE